MTILIIFVGNNNLYAQNSFQKIQDKLQGLTADTAFIKHDSATKVSINNFWKIFKELRDSDKELRKISGKISFGFSGDNSNKNDVFNLNSKVTLSKNSYPHEFSISLLNRINNNDGVIKENLSNLHMSFDHFFTDIKKPLSIEGYTFINKRTDEQLGVNRRFEIGLGVIAAHWGKIIDKDNKQKFEGFSKQKLKYINGSIQLCDTHCVRIPNSNVDSADFAKLEDARNEIASMTLKKYSPYRLGLLIGAFYEVESVTASDTVFDGVNMISDKVLFLSKNKFRWELRPTIDIKVTKEISIKVRPYFKLPMPWEWTVEVEGVEKADYRIDFPVILNFEFVNGLKINLNYTLFYDNAPSSQLYEIKDLNLNNQYITANYRHHFINFGVEYGF